MSTKRHIKQKTATALTITVFKSSAFVTPRETFKRRSTTTKPRLVSCLVNGLSARANIKQFVDKTKLMALINDFHIDNAEEFIKAADNMYRQINYTRGDTDVLVCRGIGAQDAYVKMNGNAVFRFAVDVLKQGIDEILKKSDMTLDDIDYIVCHQANERIINHVKKKYPGHEDKFYINIAEYGNTSAASIPIALDELAQRGCFDKGRKLILAGFGAGLSWSSALIET